MSRVAFMGLGNMGLGMAHRLLQSGHDVRVYNRTASKASALRDAGAHVCASPREASQGVDAVIAMTADDVSSRAVWLGPEGVLQASLAPNALAIECSTLSHGWVTQLATVARTRNLRYIDAPVTGLPENAAAGTLTLLVGAEQSDLEAARGLFTAIAQCIFHFGGVGSGTAYKLIINMIGAVQIASLAEGIAMAERAGLDLEVVAEAVSAGQAASPQVVRNARRMAANDHDRNIVFTPALRLKDVDYAVGLARQLGIGSPFGRLAGEQLRRLCALGLQRVNESKVIEIARSQSPDV